MKKNIIPKLTGLFKGLIPRMEASGLWLTDGLVQYHNFSRGRSEQISFRLPPGVISEGKVQNSGSLVKILTELHKRTSPKSRKSQSIILTIPITNVYVQPFVLPAVAAGNIKESAQLNMRMMSPIEIDKAYYSWQQISGDNQDQVEMLGAFVLGDVVDGFIECAQNAGYSVAAVEFHTLSLSRAAMRAGVIDGQTPSMFLQVMPEGLNFSVNHLGSLFFHRFIPWNSFSEGGKTISADKFKSSLVDEIRKIVNFYLTNRKGTEVKKMILISSTFTVEIGQLMAENFPGIEVITADPKQINPAIGAALRGLALRSRDDEISLSPLDTVETFEKYQLANFLGVWRNILSAALGALLLIFLSSALILQGVSARIAIQNPFGQIAQSSELLELETQAQKFNALVTIVGKLITNRQEINGVISKLNELSKNTGIQLIRININSNNSLVLVEGIAGNRTVITAFENALKTVPQFTDIDLSLADIRTQPDGTETFFLTFQVSGYNF